MHNLEETVGYILDSNRRVDPGYMLRLARQMDSAGIYVDICSDARHVFHRLTMAREGKQAHFRAFQTAGNSLSEIPSTYKYGVVITHTGCGASNFSAGYGSAEASGTLDGFLKSAHVAGDDVLCSIPGWVDADIHENSLRQAREQLASNPGLHAVASMTYDISTGTLGMQGVFRRSPGGEISFDRMNYMKAERRGRGSLGFVGEEGPFSNFAEVSGSDPDIRFFRSLEKMMQGNETYEISYQRFIARPENSYLFSTQRPKIIEINFTDLVLQEYTLPDDLFDHAGEVFTIRDTPRQLFTAKARAAAHYAWGHFTRTHMDLGYSATTVIIASSEGELKDRADEIFYPEGAMDKALARYMETERGKIVGLIVNNDRADPQYGRFRAAYRLTPGGSGIEYSRIGKPMIG